MYNYDPLTCSTRRRLALAVAAAALALPLAASLPREGRLPLGVAQAADDAQEIAAGTDPTSARGQGSGSQGQTR